MKYHEILALYQAGALDDATRAQVEAELEKHEAIDSFLFDTLDPVGAAPDTPENGEGQPEEQKLLRQIRRTVRRSFIKMGLVVGIVVLALVLAVGLILPDLVDTLYYAPDEKISGTINGSEEQLPRIYLDLSVWSELFLPSKYQNHAYVESLGYGRYSMVFSGVQADDRSGTRVAGSLVRDRLTLYDPNAFNLDYAYFHLPDDTYDRELSFWVLEEELKQDLSYVACVTLNEPVAYAELYEWCVDQKKTNGLWFNVDAPVLPNASRWGFAMGFALDQTTSKLLIPDFTVDGGKYPRLMEPVGWDFDESSKKEHFISLLRYTKDHPEFTKLMGNLHPQYQAYLDHMIQYVEENGLWINGFSFLGTREEILALRDEPMIRYVCASPAD